MAAFAVVAAALLCAQALVLGLRGHQRVRDQLAGTMRVRVEAARPRLLGIYDRGTDSQRDRMVEEAVRLGLGDVAEAFSTDGVRLAAHPRVAHEWGGDRLPPLGDNRVVSGAEAAEDGQRLVTYFRADAGPAPVVVRVSARSPALDADLRDRNDALASLGVALLMLVVAGVIVLAPVAAIRGEPPPLALAAYEQAMARLHRHGEELGEMHAAERRRMEGALRDSEALSRAGELTAGIVHEVRNGLGTIVGYARLLEKSGDAEAAAHGASIREECESLEVVVRRFMEYVRRESLTLVPVDLGRMLRRVVARESARRPGPQVSVAGEDPGIIMADEELLERAFENLVRNALEAAGVRGRVEVEARRRDGTVEVRVSDDGPGLSQPAGDALRPFFTTRPGGMGLGLPIAHKMVRLHRGELVLGPGPARGLTALVRLPAGGPEAGSGSGRPVPAAPV